MQGFVCFIFFLGRTTYAGSCSAPVPLDLVQKQSSSSTLWLITLVVAGLLGMALAAYRVRKRS